MSTSITDRVLPTFLAESREVLQEMEDGLLAVGQSADLTEAINAIFRAAHTIKGSAGLFDLGDIVKFTHVVETVLDGVRQGRVEMSSDLISLLLLCVDHIRAMVEELAAGRPTLNEALAAQQGPLLERLARFSAAKAVAAHGTPPAPSEGAPELQVWEERSAAAPSGVGPGLGSASPAGGDAVADHDHWHLSIRFGRNVLRNGMEPLSILNYLGKVGTIRKLVTIPDPAGLVEAMDPESCYLGFEIAFESTADKAAIEGAFEFVRDDCRLTILPPRSRVAEYLRLIHDQPDGVPALGQILVRCGSITERELDAALKVQSSAPEQKVGAILVQQEAVSPGLVDAAVAKQAQLREARAQDGRSIRVDAEKLDNLINLVGELIIAAARTDMVGRRARSTELQECTSSLSTLVQHVRDSALQLRMVKIAATFNRFQRVVHDVSRELGKDIGLVVAGEETELDKTVVEKISDPLMHLVRNA
ncbi:MAG TPA: Hpt domain-containing protein, partial [Polyangia bacterium]